MSALRKVLHAFRRHQEPELPEDVPDVVVFDSAAEGPRDLDDPFHENHVQARIGGLIAQTGRKK
jgi:hypothetical protein